MIRHKDYLAVYLDCSTYRLTYDMVFSGRGDVHLFSRWPAIHEVLKMLRAYMVLDDLSAA